jgi:nitroreductase
MSDELATLETAPARDILDVLSTRQSLIKFRPERPSADAIRTLLSAAVRAPNHHRNEPWRFIVVAGEARERVGEAFASCARRHLPSDVGAAADPVVEAERMKAFRSPVIIVVACIQNEHPKAMRIEDVEATAAAVQNILIAAHAIGLAAAWRTGKAAYDDEVKRRLGLAPEDDIVAFVYVGHPIAERPPLTARGPIEDVTRWEGWETE